MAAVGDNNFMRYIYRGEDGEIIPDGATHITVAEDVTVVRAWAFLRHPSIVEVICHEGVEKIEEWAFGHCPSLRRVIMPGVKIARDSAFCDCRALTDVECGKLEIIGYCVFGSCKSLKSINAPSARLVGDIAFSHCRALVDVKFSNKLERIDLRVFVNCPSLERITIPLKDGIIHVDDTFYGCRKLNYIDLVEGELHETIVALHLEAWRIDMKEEIDSINQILPNADAGDYEDIGGEDDGEKAQVIRRWIRLVLRKINHYQAEHQRILDFSATTLQLALPHDIVTNNVMPLLALPSYTFEVGYEDEDSHSDSYSDESSSEGEESEMEEDSSEDGH